jgi:hypothetical protein
VVRIKHPFTVLYEPLFVEDVDVKDVCDEAKAM